MNRTLEQQKQDFIDWFFIQIPYWPTPDQCFDKIIACYQQSQQSGDGWVNVDSLKKLITTMKDNNFPESVIIEEVERNLDNPKSCIKYSHLQAPDQ